MKHEKAWTALTGAVLAFLASWGTVGCLISALSLPLSHPAKLTLVCAGMGAMWSCFLCLPRGGRICACVLALAAGYGWHDGRAWQQLLDLTHHLSVIYDRAYGWGTLLPGRETGSMDLVLAVIAGIISLGVCLSVCRQKTVWIPMAAVILPLCSCIVVTDTVPGELWLLSVLLSLLLLLLSASVRRENAAQGLRLTAGAALPVLAGLIALFLAVPQNSYKSHAQPIRDRLSATAEKVPQILENGMLELAVRLPPPRKVHLTRLGERTLLPGEVMEVTAPESGPLYLRQQDYDGYDGKDWTSDAGRQEDFFLTEGTPQQITIRCRIPLVMRPLPYYPAEELYLTGGGIQRAGDEDISLTRIRLPDNWRQTACGGTQENPPGMERYLALPAQTRQAAEDMLLGLLPSHATNTEKADILAAFVTDSAVYDRNPSRMPPDAEDFALWFLREGERGYCVHFATAATVLLRAAGVPARYVTGYLTQTTAGQPVTVTGEDAHAWAEYYEPNLGLWLPLEATPAGQDTPTAPATQQTTAPTQPTETTLPEVAPETTLPETTAPGFQPTQSGHTDPVPTEPGQADPEPDEQSFSLPWRLLWLPVLLLAAEAQRALRRHHVQRQWVRGSANRQALHRWRTAERLSRLLGREPEEELLALAQKAKFSRHELTQEELARFDDFCRNACRQLGKKPWYLQWIYRYIYAVR